MINFLKQIYTAYTALIFLLLVLIVLPFFFLFTLIFRSRALLPVMLLCRFIAYGLMYLCGIIYRFHRNPKVNKKQTYILVANHRSNLDGPVAAISYPGRVRYLGKKELLKLPLIGPIFKVTTVSVDRSSSESRKRSIDRMRKSIEAAEHIFIFPEGTRNKAAEDIFLPFKDGAFIIAVQTQTPILPMIFYNTDKLMPNYKTKMRPGIIDIYHLDPVDVTGLTEADVKSLKQKVYDSMRQKYLEVEALHKRN